MIIFANFIPHKTRKFDYKTLEWMNKSIILSLKKRSKLAKIYHNNPSEYNKEGIINQAKKHTQLIIDAKEQNIAKMSAKLDDHKTASKTYWPILSRFLNNKNIPIMPPVFVEGKLISDFKKKVEPF